MSLGKEQALSFIMDKVKDGKQDEAKALINECFEKQASGELSKAYIASIVPKMLMMVKLESLQEVKGMIEKLTTQK